MQAIIQARMSSKRLPGKSIRLLCGEPLLSWVVKRLRRAKSLSGIVIATSDRSEDDEIVRLAQKSGVACYRGPLEDVRERFVSVVSEMQIPEFVRISGDSPLIDPALIDHAVSLYRRNSVDLVTNVLIRSFPRGQSVEVLKSAKFLKSARIRMKISDKEHVTSNYYQHPKKYQILSFDSDVDFSKVQLSVDCFADLTRMERIMESCDPETVGWLELTKIFNQHE